MLDPMFFVSNLTTNNRVINPKQHAFHKINLYNMNWFLDENQRHTEFQTAVSTSSQ